MRALVTGGAGFVGTNLIIRLIKEGHELDWTPKINVKDYLLDELK